MNSKHFLVGITLIKNGHTLGYPFVECIKSLVQKCDAVIVNVGIGTDNTFQTVSLLQAEHPKIKMVISDWDMSNTGDGSELARQANLLLAGINSEWVVYLQADEFLHWEPHHQFYKYLDTLDSDISQVELLRTYFWKELDMRAPAYETYLGRIFRPGTHKVGGDGMYLERFSGRVARSDYWIYHYSRMGPEEKVAARVKNLDQMFHDDVSVTPTFTYNEKVNLIPYHGSHPDGIQEFYSKPIDK